MKKKTEARLLQSAIMVASGPRPKHIDEHQEVKDPFLFDMNVIKAREEDARVEEVEKFPTRSQRVQQGIFRVPPSLLLQEDEGTKVLEDEVLVLDPTTRKVAMVQESARSEEESDSSHSSSRSLDTDATWETESRFSRYELMMFLMWMKWRKVYVSCLSAS
ncbi:hypothetical protein GOP47_0016046 [Adiantum capillus-veneris]|uniref:Uncharacterized protein n=1 Tax=Adiantum capillus-veneris TaxID=13818 RepID=A0A9D4ZDT4_ADICA|nr:hypothetical protein GOP47_0016046 [Adiantum capillus-veneris]